MKRHSGWLVWAMPENRGGGPSKTVVAGLLSASRAACFTSITLLGVLTSLADCGLVPLFQTPLKKTNALIAQMGITFLNAVSVYITPLNFRPMWVCVVCI